MINRLVNFLSCQARYDQFCASEVNLLCRQTVAYIYIEARLTKILARCSLMAQLISSVMMLTVDNGQMSSPSFGKGLCKKKSNNKLHLTKLTKKKMEAQYTLCQSSEWNTDYEKCQNGKKYIYHIHFFYNPRGPLTQPPTHDFIFKFPYSISTLLI